MPFCAHSLEIVWKYWNKLSVWVVWVVISFTSPQSWIEYPQSSSARHAFGRHKTNKYWARHRDMSRPFCRLWVQLLLEVVRKKQLVPPNLADPTFPMWQIIHISPDSESGLLLFQGVHVYKGSVAIKGTDRNVMVNGHGLVMFHRLHSLQCHVGIAILVPNRQIKRQAHLSNSCLTQLNISIPLKL